MGGRREQARGEALREQDPRVGLDAEEGGRGQTTPTPNPPMESRPVARSPAAAPGKPQTTGVEWVVAGETYALAGLVICGLLPVHIQPKGPVLERASLQFVTPIDCAANAHTGRPRLPFHLIQFRSFRPSQNRSCMASRLAKSP